jgi:hypothetical protein
VGFSASSVNTPPIVVLVAGNKLRVLSAEPSYFALFAPRLNPLPVDKE